MLLANSFISWMIKLDKEFFLYLNTKLTNPFLDSVLPWFRNSTNWIPFYIILLIFIGYKLKKYTLYWILGVAINTALSDQISSTFIKKTFARLRPCQDEEMKAISRLLLPHCSGGYSFTSSHATNHFALAMFICITLATVFKNYRYLFFVWAGIICYAQVYVGVHYPLDVVAGGILGCLIGFFTGKLFNKYFNKSLQQNN